MDTGVPLRDLSIEYGQNNFDTFRPKKGTHLMFSFQTQQVVLLWTKILVQAVVEMWSMVSDVCFSWNAEYRKIGSTWQVAIGSVYSL